MSNDISELQAVDFAFGAFLSDAFQGLVSTSGPLDYRSFVGRARNKQIFRHEFDTPKEFIDKLRSTQANTRATAGGNINVPQLPVVGYGRKPGMTTVDDEPPRIRGKVAHAGDADHADHRYMLRPLAVVLNYNLAIVAHDKLSLDKLSLAIYAYLAWKDRFTVQYSIGADTFDTGAQIREHKAISWTDASLPPSEDRMFALTAEIEVYTQVLFGENVTVNPATLWGIHVGYFA